MTGRLNGRVVVSDSPPALSCTRVLAGQPRRCGKPAVFRLTTETFRDPAMPGGDQFVGDYCSGHTLPQLTRLLSYGG